MHLSLLSDSFLSDRLNDSGIRFDRDPPSPGRAHRDGVVRGLCFVAILALPVLLTLGASFGDKAAAAFSMVRHTATPATPASVLRMERRS